MVSGGFRHIVEETLVTIGIRDLFPIVITPQDVQHGKPAPDMFLLAAEKMKVPPESCLVFEDGIVGIEGAAGPECNPSSSPPGLSPPQHLLQTSLMMFPDGFQQLQRSQHLGMTAPA
ncbi:MAG: HAD family hydrolase [Blastochloris sp.]|nr:HAD family hydrolase [Blastochloris sp.]